MSKPRITVLMSVYNGRRYLAEAMESILRQTRSDFEFLIIDDGSVEPVAEIIESFEDPRIRFFRQENQGLTRTLNRGLRLARGQYIARMDADDVSYPERLEAQAAELDAAPSLDLVGCFFHVIDDRGAVIETKELPLDSVYRLWRLQFHNNYAHGSVMLRKDAVMRVGMYDEGLTCAQDFDLWCRLSRADNTKILPRTLYAHRIRSDGAQTSVRHYSAQLATAALISNRCLMACNPDLEPEQCADVRALYWKFEREHLPPDRIECVMQTFDGFCRRFGLADTERSRLERQFARDTTEELRRIAGEIDPYKQR